MKIATKYIYKELCLIMFYFIFAGTFIYLFIDVIDRIDRFFKYGVSYSVIFYYFVLKVPLIVSQIFPVIVFLSIIIFFSIFINNNEVLVLLSGGVDYNYFFKIVFLFSLFLFFFYLFVFQEISSKLMLKTNAIWRKDVMKKELLKKKLYHIWIKQENKIINIIEYDQKKHRGSGVNVIILDDQDQKVKELYKAKKCVYQNNKLILYSPTVIIPDKFTIYTQNKKIFTNLKLNFKMLALLKSKLPKNILSFFTLANLLFFLKKSGINTTEVLTALLAKFAYSFSILVLAMLALGISLLFKNMVKSVLIGLVIIFAYYTVFTLGTTLSQKSICNPFLGTWMANFFFGVLSILVLKKVINKPF